MRIRYLAAAVAAAMLALAAPAGAATVTPFTGSGDDAAGLQPTVDAFRAALGSQRREIHWGDVPTRCRRRTTRIEGRSSPPPAAASGCRPGR
jgi:hypothetical protein